jgi:hypothetical protein
MAGYRRYPHGCIPSGKFGQLAVIPKLWIVYNATIGGANEIEAKART